MSATIPARARRATRKSSIRRSSMRAIDCPCGHHLEAPDDEELTRLAREHIEMDHPEMERTDDQIRARIAADAHDC
jgi:predicted small metal-binding protein